MEAHHIRISVSGTSAGAASARQQIAEEIRDWGAVLGSELLDAAELVASELITNAVRHAHEGPITAGADLHGKALRIAVTDANSDIPKVGLPHAEAEDGRGLFLVAALADRHGFDPLPSGKRCWAEFEFSAPLPVPAAHLPQQRS
ncbi:ATP-binding protein [Streptomyces sp. VRA16 Mangrove soil]|uniref:ATP-binding protein n=1 Tax=Streptomyces sp. VRA16 Mangrove soil TaxID=2817434 RepID=UPI001A9D643B|nr:ATP-binding protein [Streptomyces sp. VRA16 Mangrove soil]MBO1333742.1 ATP-binding protein [Streptomyces sp. VRA16 Mangrove soil]